MSTKAKYESILHINRILKKVRSRILPRIFMSDSQHRWQIRMNMFGKQRESRLLESQNTNGCHADTNIWECATLHQLPLPMRGGRQSGSMHSQNVITGGHNSSLLQGKEYTTSLPARPTWPLALSPICHSSTLNMLAEQPGNGDGTTKPCD
jgi:hypothetical protein